MSFAGLLGRLGSGCDAERSARVRDSVQRARHADEIVGRCGRPRGVESLRDRSVRRHVDPPGCRRLRRSTPDRPSAHSGCASRRQRLRAGRACAAMPVDVLVRADRDHEVQPLRREELAERPRERLGARRVVRAVEHDRRMSPGDLEPARATEHRRARFATTPRRATRRAATRRRRSQRRRCAPRAPRATAGTAHRRSRIDPRTEKA